MYDRSRDSTDDFMAHLQSIPKKCQDTLIKSYADSFGTSLGTRHNFVTLSASIEDTMRAKAIEPAVANLIDLDIDEAIKQQPIVQPTIMKTTEIMTAFEEAVTTARAPVVKRMLSAIEDKMLCEFRTTMDKLADDTMKSMLRFEQTTDELTREAQYELQKMALDKQEEPNTTYKEDK